MFAAPPTTETRVFARIPDAKLLEGPSFDRAGHLWIVDIPHGRVFRVTPDGHPTRIAFGAGAVWVTITGDGQVARIDPRSNVVTARIPVGRQPVGITFAEGSAWVAVRQDQQLVDLYGPLVYFWCRRIGLPAEDASDMLQEVFLSVIRNLDSFHGGSRFQTWLFRIATNKARDYRERRNAAKRGGGLARVSLDGEALAVETLVDEVLAVDTALARLEAVDERLARLVEWRYFGGMTDVEIAAALGVTDRTLRRDWLKARAFLYRELARGAP